MVLRLPELGLGRGQPRNGKAALNYARSLKALDRKAEAFAVLQSSYLYNAQDREYLSEFGRLALDQGHAPMAQQLLERADDPAKPDWRVLSARGVALAQQGHYKAALPFLERARALGYRFDPSGELVATPSGQPLVRAAAVAGQPGVQVDKALGPDSWVREVRIPAEYRNVNRYVPEQAAGVRVVEVPAAYRTIRRRVEVEPARTESLRVPATYKTVPTQVLVRAESTRSVTEPAELTAVTRYTLDQPAALRQVPVPALVQPVERPVVVRAASMREEVVPAVYRSETRQVIDQPAGTRWVEVPAQVETLSWQVKVTEPREERREVLCETNTPPDKIREVQRALQAAGFSPGAADGVLAAPTLAAVARYQQARGLPVHGYLDIETVRALGVAPN